MAEKSGVKEKTENVIEKTKSLVETNPYVK